MLRRPGQLFFSLVTAFLLVDHAVAAPAPTTFNITDYITSSPGCPAESFVYEPQEAGKLVFQMPGFEAVTRNNKEEGAGCSLTLSLTGTVAGYQLDVKSLSLDAYLLTNGPVTVSRGHRVAWYSFPERGSEVRLFLTISGYLALDSSTLHYIFFESTTDKLPLVANSQSNTYRI